MSVSRRSGLGLTNNAGAVSCQAKAQPFLLASLLGWVTSRKVAAANRWAIFADADELARLQRLRQVPRSWPDPYPSELITPKIAPPPSHTEAPH